MIDNLTESVILSSEIDQWKPTILNCIEDFNNIENLYIMNDILNISSQHKLVSYPAAILYHSKKINN